MIKFTNMTSILSYFWHKIKGLLPTAENTNVKVRVNRMNRTLEFYDETTSNWITLSDTTGLVNLSHFNSEINKKVELTEGVHLQWGSHEDLEQTSLDGSDNVPPRDDGWETDGVYLAQNINESSGIFLNGDGVHVWAPDYPFNIYDEDNLDKGPILRVDTDGRLHRNVNPDTPGKYMLSWVGTEEEYLALGSWDNDTVYYII